MTPVPSEILEQSIAILGTSGITEDDIEAKVAQLVEDRMTARRLIDWIPEAFGIVLVSHIAKLVLPKTFQAKTSGGQWQEFEFDREPIFTASVPIAMHMYHNGPREVFRNISVRSSSLNVVNKTLNAGNSLEGATLSGPALIGIPAEIYQHKAKPFWRRLFSD